MRKKLLKLLRDAENDTGFKNEYKEFIEEYGCDYAVEEYLDFPNYRFITKKFNDDNIVEKNGLIIPFSGNSIKAELKRMESDGLVMISVQTGARYANCSGTQGPELEDCSIDTESVMLETKGKSRWKYFWHQVVENPFAVFALIISVVSLVFSIYKL